MRSHARRVLCVTTSLVRDAHFSVVRTAARGAADERGAREVSAVCRAVVIACSLQGGILTTEEAIHLARGFERTAHLGQRLRALPGDRTTVRICCAAVSAVATGHLVQTDGRADDGAPVDPAEALIGSGARLPSIGWHRGGTTVTARGSDEGDGDAERGERTNGGHDSLHHEDAGTVRARYAVATVPVDRAELTVLGAMSISAASGAAATTGARLATRAARAIDGGDERATADRGAWGTIADATRTAIAVDGTGAVARYAVGAAAVRWR